VITVSRLLVRSVLVSSRPPALVAEMW
jgi:hypothetical protein